MRVCLKNQGKKKELSSKRGEKAKLLEGGATRKNQGGGKTTSGNRDTPGLSYRGELEKGRTP